MSEISEMQVELTKSEVEKGSKLTDLEGKLDWEKFLEKYWGKILPLLLGGLLIGGGLVFSKVNQQSESGSGIEILTAEDSVEQNLEQNTVFVDIAGAVMNPGVYELPNESRVNDLLIAAGGLSAEADREWVEANLNRAQELRDGVKVYIPSRDEVGSQATVKSGVVAEQASVSQDGEEKYFGVLEPKTGLVNINTASLSELDSLPGIGSAYAQRMIDYRETHGGFKSIEEIKNVPGIGQKTFEKIKEKITI